MTAGTSSTWTRTKSSGSPNDLYLGDHLAQIDFGERFAYLLGMISIMLQISMKAAIAALIAIFPAAVAAQEVTAAPATERAEDVLAREVPVTAGVIGDRPYVVLGRVDVYVQRTVWQGTPSQAKVYRELWERAQRLGADAVIQATFGSAQHEFARSWGGRDASGDAIRFVTTEEAERIRGGQQ